MNILEAKNKEKLLELIKNNDNLIIDFFSEWCQPCKLYNGILKELNEIIEKNNLQLKIIKFNIENDLKVSDKLKITVIPTTFFIKKSIIEEIKEGVIQKNELFLLIEKIFGIKIG